MRARKLFFICMFIAAASMLAQKKGLFAHWKLDLIKEGKIIDSGPNHLDGSLKNSEFLSLEPGPAASKALFFDAKKGIAKAKRSGGAVIVIPGMGNFDITKKMSISVWYKLSEDASDKSGLELLSTAKSEHGPGFRIQYCYKLWRLLSGDGKKLAKLHTSPARNKIAKGVWTHLTIVFDGKRAFIYLDGSLAAESPQDEAFHLTNGDDILTVGGYSRGYWYFFDGNIADLKLYTRVLTPTEIMREAKDLPEDI